MVGFNGMYPGGYPAYNNSYANQAYQERMAQIQSNYQQALPQAAPQQPAQVQAPATINQGLLWVQGEAGAKAYLMAPNTTVLLMDSENERFYIKSTDGAGMPNLRVFEYQEMHPNTQQSAGSAPEPAKIDTSMFVGREEFEGLKLQYSELMKRLESFEKEPVTVPARVPNRPKRTGGDINE